MWKILLSIGGAFSIIFYGGATLMYIFLCYVLYTMLSTGMKFILLCIVIAIPIFIIRFILFLNKNYK